MFEGHSWNNKSASKISLKIPSPSIGNYDVDHFLKIRINWSADLEESNHNIETVCSQIFINFIFMVIQLKWFK